MSCDLYPDGSADVIIRGAFSMTMAELIMDEFASTETPVDGSLAK